MITDEHGNHILNETETAVLRELQEWKCGDIVADWTFYGEYLFKLVREDENQHRPGRERQARYQRRLRLYEHRSDLVGINTWHNGWYACLGGQWHDSIYSGYQRAKYMAHCYNYSKLEKAQNQRSRELRTIAERLRPRHITKMTRRISI